MSNESVINEEGTFGLSCWSGQSRGMAAAHRHLDLEINYVLSGTMTYLVAGKIVDLPPRRICLLWGGVPHQMIRGRLAADVIWVTIPLATVLRWRLPERLIRPLLATGFVADSVPRSGDLDLLRQWIGDIPGPSPHRTPHNETDAPLAEIVMLEIEARLRRLALGLSLPQPEQSAGRREEEALSDSGLSGAEAMARFISKNFHEGISIAEIAEEVHLHPNYAMTLFRRHTGLTLSQYLTLQRVAHAQRLLATSDNAIQAIALDSGFGSVSRFYEAFKQQTGNSPRRFRLQMGAARR